MNLIQQIESDLSFTLEDADFGFGVVVKFLNVHEEWVALHCQTTDVVFFLDTETSAAVNARTVEVVVRIASLEEANIPWPEQTSVVKYTPTHGEEQPCKIQRIDPDRKMGIIRLTLEGVRNG